MSEAEAGSAAIYEAVRLLTRSTTGIYNKRVKIYKLTHSASRDGTTTLLFDLSSAELLDLAKKIRAEARGLAFEARMIRSIAKTMKAIAEKKAEQAASADHDHAAEGPAVI